MALRPFLFLLSLLLAPPWSLAAGDLMDQYLSVPGAYTFVRRAPEGQCQAESDDDFRRLLVSSLLSHCYRVDSSPEKKYGDRLEVRFFGYPFIHPESRMPARAHAIAQEMGLGEQMQQALFRARFEEELDTTSRAGWPRWQTASVLLPNSY